MEPAIAAEPTLIAAASSVAIESRRTSVAHLATRQVAMKAARPAHRLIAAIAIAIGVAVAIGCAESGCAYAPVAVTPVDVALVAVITPVAVVTVAVGIVDRSAIAAERRRVSVSAINAVMVAI